MKTGVLLFLFTFPFFCLSQINIDLREKSIDDISGDIYYSNVDSPFYGYEISGYSNEYKRFRTNLTNIGCPIALTNKNQTKLITANYAGDLFFYDLPSGRLERSIAFSQLLIAMVHSTGSSKSSLISSLSLTDNEQYLIIKTFNFYGEADGFNDYYVLDLDKSRSARSPSQLGLYSFYSFPKMELLNENKILSTNPKFLQEKALAKIQELSSSKKKYKMYKRSDGIYFTADNFVPLKFINLGDKSYFEAIDFFTNPKGSFRLNANIKNISEFTEFVSNNYLLNDIIKNSNGTFALFGTSYGSKNNAVLIKIDDILNSADVLYDKSISEINTYFRAKIIPENLKLLEFESDKLYLKYEDDKFYFVSPWLDQTNKCDKPLNIWGNSYKWKFHKNITELNNLKLKFPILFDNSSNDKYNFIGWEENKLFVYNLYLNQLNNIEEPLPENQLTFQMALVNTIDLSSLLPQNLNSESIVDKKPSKDIGERLCEVCAGTGFIPDKVRNGYIRTFQRNPLNGVPVKCFNCNGSGKYKLVTGDYEKREIIQFDKWELDNVDICNSERIIVKFRAFKRTFSQESKGGYIINGTLISNEVLIFSFIINKFGKIHSYSAGDLNTSEICNEYSPIYTGH